MGGFFYDQSLEFLQAGAWIWDMIVHAAKTILTQNPMSVRTAGGTTLYSAISGITGVIGALAGTVAAAVFLYSYLKQVTDVHDMTLEQRIKPFLWLGIIEVLITNSWGIITGIYNMFTNILGSIGESTAYVMYMDPQSILDSVWGNYSFVERMLCSTVCMITMIVMVICSIKCLIAIMKHVVALVAYVPFCSVAIAFLAGRESGGERGMGPYFKAIVKEFTAGIMMMAVLSIMTAIQNSGGFAELTGMESTTTFVVRMIFLILYPALTAGLVSASDELANKMIS